MSLTPELMALLPQWVARQRWYAGKGRLPVLSELEELCLGDRTGEVDIRIHLLLDESGGARTTYQVPLTCRKDRLAGSEQALVAAIEVSGQGLRYFYDAPHDPAFAAALLRLMLHEASSIRGGSNGSSERERQ